MHIKKTWVEILEISQKHFYASLKWESWSAHKMQMETDAHEECDRRDENIRSVCSDEGTVTFFTSIQETNINVASSSAAVMD